MEDKNIGEKYIRYKLAIEELLKMGYGILSSIDSLFIYCLGIPPYRSLVLRRVEQDTLRIIDDGAANRNGNETCKANNDWPYALERR